MVGARHPDGRHDHLVAAAHRRRADGLVVTADSTAASVVQVVLTIQGGWDPGDLQLLYLDAWIDTNSATILPVRAQIS
jgi:hypothetical protein